LATVKADAETPTELFIEIKLLRLLT